MKRTAVTLGVAVLTLAVATATVWAGCGACGSHAKKGAAATVKAQTVCPVMGGKINKAQYADVDGKRIYVCCPGCIGKIKANPAKYVKKLEDAGVTLEKVPEPKGDKHSHAGHKH